MPGAAYINVVLTASLSCEIDGLLLRPGRGAEYCDQFVCLCVCVSVCLSVREHFSGTAGPIFTKFLCRSLWP